VVTTVCSMGSRPVDAFLPLNDAGVCMCPFFLAFPRLGPKIRQPVCNSSMSVYISPSYFLGKRGPQSTYSWWDDLFSPRNFFPKVAYEFLETLHLFCGDRLANRIPRQMCCHHSIFGFHEDITTGPLDFNG
jgi:hypothetical protein